MDEHYWFPRSTRNRLAMLMGFFSLVLVFFWNLMPRYALNDEKMFEPRGYFFHEWLFALPDMFSWIFSSPDAASVVTSLTYFMLPLLVTVNLVILPGWKFWQSTRALRWIAALLMFFGLVIVIRYICTPEDMIWFYFVHFRLIALNYLTTAAALLLFKNDNLPDHEYGYEPRK